MTPAQREIIEAVAAKHGLTVERLFTKVQDRRFAWPRQEAAYRLRETGRWSWLAIAAVLKQDHSTSIKGARKFELRIATASPAIARSHRLDALESLPNTLATGRVG